MRKTPDTPKNRASSIVRLTLASIVAVALAPVWGQVDLARQNMDCGELARSSWMVDEKLAAAKAYGDSIHTSAVIAGRRSRLSMGRLRQENYVLFDTKEFNQRVVRNLFVGRSD